MSAPELDALVTRLLAGGEPSALHPQHRRAAVALVLHWSHDPGVVLMRRAEREGDRWSGQLSLPGGHQDAEDDSLVATAMRETGEEVGLDLLASGRLLGHLPPLQGRARGAFLPLTVAPFVFAVEERLELSTGPEAEQAFWFPLGRAARGEADTEHRYEEGGLVRRLPAWEHGGHVIWGMTYAILSGFVARVEDILDRPPGR